MSAVNLTPLGIKEEDRNLLRNDHIKFDCGPLVYRTIIDWGFAKPDGIKIIDHINDLKIGDIIKKKNFPKWLKDNKSKLDRDSFSGLDITALHDFLPILCCNKIAQTGGGAEYDDRMKDPNSVESLLKKIKAFRNDVSHEHAEAVKDNIGKMTVTMRECIRAAGKLYGKDQTEIDSKVKVLDDEFDKVLHDTTHFYDNRVKYIAQKISSEVPSNMLERYSPYFSVPLPGSSKKIDTSDIFQCSNLSVATEDKVDKTKDNKTVFPCTEIYKNKQEKFVVINGGPGSGKTTLMRNMCKDILETSVNGSTPRYENIERFKIPIYLECRSEQQTNLATFLRECLKDFLSPEDDIMEAFKIVKGLVFLIDGYDEITDNCRKLVKSIIPFCRDNNASCIVSSRVDAGNNFVNELKKRSLNCTKSFIEPISKMSHKVSFLKSYAGKMDSSIDSDKLVKSFENLTAAAREVFSSPILLALFISLFVNDPKSVSKMKNEQSAYEAVRTNLLREMAGKLESENVRNPEGRAKDVANLLGNFCLKQFKVKKYFIEQEEYSLMVAECEKIRGMGECVDIPNLLTSILTPEHSFKYNQDKSYQFMHSTIQEFFAAKYVSENIGELPDDRISLSQSEVKQLTNLQDDRSSQSQSEDKQLTKLQDDRSSQSQSEDKQLTNLQDDRSSQSQSASSFFSYMKKAIVKKFNKRTRAIPDDKRKLQDDRRELQDDRRELPDDRRERKDDRRELRDDRSSLSQFASSSSSGPIVKKFNGSQSEDGHLPKLLQVLGLDESQSDIKGEMERYGNINKLLMLEILNREEITTHRNTFTLMLKKYYSYSPVYLLDLILSSDSNADIISIVSDCLRGKEKYYLKYYRHIKPMADVVQTLKTAVEINFSPRDTTNSQALTPLLSVLGDGSQIRLDLDHSYDNYKPLEGEFFTQLKKSKCKVTYFRACVSSEEHLNILMRSQSQRCDVLHLSCTSLYSFAVLEEYKGNDLWLMVKYSEDFSFTGNNPITERTNLKIDQIPANGNKDILFHLIKYLSPKSKQFGTIYLSNCHLTDSDAMELLEELHREKIRTGGWGVRTEVEEESVNQDQSRHLSFCLKKSKPTGRVWKWWEKSEEEESEEEESEEEESEEEESEEEE